jgi:hypothetical protein
MLAPPHDHPLSRVADRVGEQVVGHVTQALGVAVEGEQRTGLARRVVAWSMTRPST